MIGLNTRTPSLKLLCNIIIIIISLHFSIIQPPILLIPMPQFITLFTLPLHISSGNFLSENSTASLSVLLFNIDEKDTEYLFKKGFKLNSDILTSLYVYIKEMNKIILSFYDGVDVGFH